MVQADPLNEKYPTGHFVQASISKQAVPAVHIRALLHVPEQSEKESWSEAAVVASERNLLSEQTVHAAAPSVGAYVPAAHVTQSVSESCLSAEVAASERYFPMLQLVQSAVESWREAFVAASDRYFPAAQTTQSDSAS
jgi:hypothetical protein